MNNLSFGFFSFLRVGIHWGFVCFFFEVNRQMSIWGVLKSDIRPPKSLFFDFSSFSKLPKAAARLMSVFPASKNQKIELLSVQSSVVGTPICKEKS